MTDDPIKDAADAPKREVLTIYVAEAEDGIRLDRWFRRRWPNLSNIQVQKMARSGQIRVDGARIKPEGRLTAGAAVRVPPIPDDTSRQAGDAHTLSPQDIKFAKSLVLYEDDMVVHPARGNWTGTLVNALAFHFKDHLSKINGDYRPGIVHRLDRDTSGVLLLGKGPEAAKRLAGAFARRQARKTYWAIVIGNPKPGAGQIDMPLKKTGINDFEMMRPADRKDPRAEPAETAFATISRAAHRAAWMALRPFTGRTHQLRAHMAGIGHPILGDPKYGDDKSKELSGPLKLQLHARSIELEHPRGGLLKVTAPLSPEMKAGFAHFGFEASEGDESDPFEGVRRQR